MMAHVFVSVCYQAWEVITGEICQHCRTVEVAPERLQDRRLLDGSYSFGIALLKW
jgi:hypothetical protein